MKFRLKLFVLFFLLVSVALGSVAFFPITSSAVYNFTGTRLDASYDFENSNNKTGKWADYTGGKHFEFESSDNAYVDETGLHLIDSQIRLSDVAGFVQGDGFGIEIILDSYTKTQNAADNYSNIFSLWCGDNAKFVLGVNPSGYLGVAVKQDDGGITPGNIGSQGRFSEFYQLSNKKNTQIAVSCDVKEKKIYLYADGNKVFEYSVPALSKFQMGDSDKQNINNVRLGDGGAWCSEFAISRMRFYSKPISATVVKDNYNFDTHVEVANNNNLFDEGYRHIDHYHHNNVNKDDAVYEGLIGYFAGQSSGGNFWYNLVDNIPASVADGKLNSTGYTVDGSGSIVNFENGDCSIGEFFYGNGSEGRHYFSVELNIGTFAPNNDGGQRQNFLYYMTLESEGELKRSDKELVIFYNLNDNSLTDGNLMVKYPGSSTYLSYPISVANLQYSLISLTFERNSGYSNIYLYVNGNYVETSRSVYNDSISRAAWKNIRLGCGTQNCGFSSCQYRCIRFYDICLTQEQVRQNYELDKEQFGTFDTETPSVKTTKSYGVVGFDKIFNQTSSKIGATYKLSLEDGNELLEDWRTSNSLETAPQDIYNYTPVEDSILVDNFESRANFVDYGTNVNVQENLTNVRNEGYFNTQLSKQNTDIKAFYHELYGRVDDKNTDETADDEFVVENSNYQIDEHNTMLALDNTFFFRNKYKCGINSNSRLMVTADICSNSIQDVDFCGLVIDYSDAIYNHYGDERSTLYSAFDTDKTLENGYARTALFPTGVGFNIVRKQNQYGINYNTEAPSHNALLHDPTYKDDIENNEGYAMRVFIGGNGKDKKASYFDVDLSQHAIANLNSTQFHNYTIYRDYELWPFENVNIYNDGVHTIKFIKNETLVYMVKFYVDGNFVAAAAMKAIEGNDDYITLKNSGALFEISPKGTATLKSAADGSVCTFADWSQYCNYGKIGASMGSNKTTGYVESDNSHLNIGTPSGNIIFAFHRENRYVTNAWHTGDNGKRIRYLADTTDQTLCKCFIDNVGYMDYNDPKDIQDNYSFQTVLNKDMIVNFRTTMLYSYRPKEPTINFNRLGYPSSFQIDYDTTVDKTTAEYKASHGTADLSKERILGYNGAASIRTDAVNGVYFKDVDDLITYDVIDFNGVRIFTYQIRLMDYFKKLYNDEVPDESKIDDDEKQFLIDLIDFCIACQLHDGYNKNEYRGDRTGQVIPRLDEKATEPDFNSITVPTEEGSGAPNNNPSYNVKFASANLVLRSYISLNVKVNVPTGTKIEDVLSIILNGEPVAIKKYKSLYNEYFVSDSTTDLGNGVIQHSIEIPIDIDNLDDVYEFSLKNVIDGTVQDENPLTLNYSIYNYIANKWNSSTGKTKELVRRMYKMCESAKVLTMEGKINEIV